MRIFSLYYRKQMRHTMNRTDYRGRDLLPTCGCRQTHEPMPIPAHPCHGAEPAPGAQMHEHAPCAQVLAMAYVHVQDLGTLYDPCTALIAGTVFPALDKPFCGETISSSAYPNPPARTCSCSMPVRRDGCGCMKGGAVHG